MTADADNPVSADRSLPGPEAYTFPESPFTGKEESLPHDSCI
ncbi:hypothetical protein EKH55_1841 [Sinorhizobium alkalisoli]|nr:hypothetical protein EKH55_1841 [Sinorhizobium alkalisoli]